MPKNRIPLVLRVAMEDKESFKILPSRKEAKKIYDKVRARLIRQGFSDKALDFKLVAEIRQELFRLQKPHEGKESKSQIKEGNFLDRKNFMVHGVDLFSEHVPEIDPIDRELKIWEKNTEIYMNQHCPICKSYPCICRYEGEMNDG
jgi:hypothetical protein